MGERVDERNAAALAEAISQMQADYGARIQALEATIAGLQQQIPALQQQLQIALSQMAGSGRTS